MKKKDRIFLLFNIQRDERNAAFTLFLLAFFCGLTVVFTGTAANAYFVSSFDTSLLPLTYIIVGLVIFFISKVLSRLEQSLPYTRYIAWVLFIQLGLLLFFRFAPTGESFVLGAIFFIWKNILLFILNLMLWGLSNRLLSIRQGKRLFGFIGAGEVLAEIAGGFAGAFLIPVAGTDNLILFSAGTLIGVIILGFMTFSRLREDRKDKIPPLTQEISGKKRNSFSIIIYSITTLIWLGFLFLENVFYNEAKVQFSDKEALGSFFSLFFAVAGILTFFSKLFVSDKIVIRLGINRSLFILPIGGVLFFGLYSSSVFIEAPIFLFQAAAISMLLYKFLRSSVQKSSMMVLCQPIPSKIRHQILLTAERFGGVIAGTILFLLVTPLKIPYPQISFSLVPLFLGSLFFIPFVISRYKEALKEALENRTLEEIQPLLIDKKNIQPLEASLTKESPGQVLYALQALEKANRKKLPWYLKQLLRHPNRIIRKKALYEIGNKNLNHMLPVITALLNRETDATLLGLILRTIMALGGSRSFKTVSPYVQDPRLPVKRGALVGLLRYGGIEGVLAGGSQLLKLISSRDPEKRRTGARIIDNIGIKEFYTPLEKLLKDKNPGVRKTALQAAAKIANPVLVPKVVFNLSEPALQSLAVQALLKMGNGILPFLKKEYFKRKQSLEIRLNIIKTLGQMRRKQVIPLLLEILETPVKPLLHQTLGALTANGFKVKYSEAGPILKILKRERKDSIYLQKIRENFANPLLKEAITEELTRNKKRLLMLLSFITSGNTIIEAGKKIASPSGEYRDYALELIEIVIPEILKDEILPVFESKTLPKKMAASRGEKHSLLMDFIKKSKKWKTFWLTVCALHLLTEKEYLQNKGLISSLLSDNEHKTTRETAYGIIKKFDSLKVETGQNRPALTITEKVVLLKNSNLFKEIPIRILTEIAPETTTKTIDKGQKILKKDSPGSSMFILISGQVEVSLNKKNISKLRKGDVFGELSMLDSAPRSADVTAGSDCKLLKLDQTNLYALLKRRKEFALQVIRFLASRIRECISRITSVKRKQNISFSESKVTSLKALMPIEKLLFLNSISLFSRISHAILSVVLTFLKERTFNPGDIILKEGEPPEGLYMIMEGLVEDHKKPEFHNKYSSTPLYGDLELFIDSPNLTTLQACTTVKAFLLPGEALFELIDQFSSLRKSIVRALTKRYRNFQEETGGMLVASPTDKTKSKKSESSPK